MKSVGQTVDRPSVRRESLRNLHWSAPTTSCGTKLSRSRDTRRVSVVNMMWRRSLIWRYFCNEQVVGLSCDAGRFVPLLAPMHYDCIRFLAVTDNCLSAEHPTHLEINLIRGRRLLRLQKPIFSVDRQMMTACKSRTWSPWQRAPAVEVTLHPRNSKIT